MRDSVLQFASAHPVVAAIVVIIGSFALVPVVWLLWYLSHAFMHEVPGAGWQRWRRKPKSPQEERASLKK